MRLGGMESELSGPGPLPAHHMRPGVTGRRWSCITQDRCLEMLAGSTRSQYEGYGELLGSGHLGQPALATRFPAAYIAEVVSMVIRAFCKVG